MFQEKLNGLNIENLLCDILGCCQELKKHVGVIYYDGCYFLGARKEKLNFLNIKPYSIIMWCSWLPRAGNILYIYNILLILQSMLVGILGAKKTKLNSYSE